MASKRNSRVYLDDTFIQRDDSQAQMGSLLSRRSSHSSFMADVAADMEGLQRQSSISWESISSSTSSSSGRDGPKPIDDTVITVSTSSDEPSTDDTDHAIPASTGRPLNFGVVVPGFYRSSYPKPQDYDFLRDLDLKTVVTLVKTDELDQELESFVSSSGIHQVIFNMKGTKKEAIRAATMRSILELVMDRRNYPLLLHCNHGKHRTGCVIAAVRKLSGWDVNTVIDEYKSYAEPKVRECDLEYINAVQVTTLRGAQASAQPATFTPMQLRTFFRTLLFTAFVLVVWLVSGSQIPASPGAPR